MKSLLLIAALIVSPWLMAEEARPLAADPVAEKRLQSLSEELRCLVCQNQSIADSNADLAKDLKREIRALIQAGKSDREIVDFLVARYGDFVLYKPPLKGATLLLWGGPGLFLIVGIALLIRQLRRRARQVAAEPELDAAAARRAEELLKSGQ